MPPSLPSATAPRRISRWWEKTVALIAALNLLLVVADLSYIPFRSIYLRYFPELTTWYGAIFKGIEPQRDTEAYLVEVNRLQAQIAETGLRSPEASAILVDLRALSEKMIGENPFEIANRPGVQERIKNEMRDRVGADSSTDAFNTFWSPDYLEQQGVQRELQFFNRRIRPYLATNYSRQVNEHGEFIDRFWVIDLPFLALFWFDFLARTYVLSRRYARVSWLDTILWRWFDIPLLLPFWRWMRILPVTLRLNESQLINLEPFRARLTQRFVTGISTELTEVVVLRSIDQIQVLLKDGTLNQWLVRISQRRFVDLNGVDELEAIANQLITVTLNDVLPQLKPDLRELVNHNLDRVIAQTPAYQGIQYIPGLNQLPTQISAQLANDLTEGIYTLIVTYLSDPVAIQMTRQLLTNLGNHFLTSIRQEHTIDEMTTLLHDLLDEVKFNYATRFYSTDLQTQIAQNNRLYEVVRTKSSE